MVGRVASDLFRPLTSAGRLINGPMGSSTWLLHLRFFAVAGQFITIAVAEMLVDITLPLAWLFGLVGVTAITNAGYGWWLRQHRSRSDRSDSHPLVAIVLMALDLVTLTAMLHLSGGVDNPFSFFFFVNLAVGGVAIANRSVWSLTATAIGGYSFLLLYSDPLPVFNSPSITHTPWLTVSRIVAFATCSSVVTYYVTHTAAQSQLRHDQLMRLQETEQTDRRLRSLTTLAAGAAHELATPLSTIDVVVREMSHHLESCEKPETVDQDLRLIDGELDRCRSILGRMRAAAGDSAAERFRQTTVGDLIDTSLEGVRQPHRVDVADCEEEVEATPMWVPTETVAQAIRNLIHNGLDASDPASRVRLDFGVDDDAVEFRVADDGQGMAPEELSRITEPFYTTKPPGRGMGLGLYLTRNVISQLGGDIEFESEPGRGTRVTVRLPRQTNALAPSNNQPTTK